MISNDLFIIPNGRLSLVVDIAATSVGFLTVMLLNSQRWELLPIKQQVMHKSMM